MAVVLLHSPLRDMLIRGGENVYPAEIEDFLLTHPDIAAVEVFGVPDERYREEVCAFEIPQPGRGLSRGQSAAAASDWMK